MTELQQFDLSVVTFLLTLLAIFLLWWNIAGKLEALKNTLQSQADRRRADDRERQALGEFKNAVIRKFGKDEFQMIFVPLGLYDGTRLDVIRTSSGKLVHSVVINMMEYPTEIALNYEGDRCIGRRFKIQKMEFTVKDFISQIEAYLQFLQ